jgi:hypothetical protein
VVIVDEECKKLTPKVENANPSGKRIFSPIRSQEERRINDLTSTEAVLDLTEAGKDELLPKKARLS